jgi:hypothetical protein
MKEQGITDEEFKGLKVGDDFFGHKRDTIRYTVSAHFCDPPDPTAIFADNPTGETILAKTNGRRETYEFLLDRDAPYMSIPPPAIEDQHEYSGYESS